MDHQTTVTSLATQTIPKASSGSSLGKWIFALAEERTHRLIFALPWKRVMALGLLSAAVGAVLLHPAFVDAVHPYLRYFAGGTLIALGLLFAATAASSEGQLTIDGLGRVVRFRLQTPWQHVSWIKPFDEFERVQFYQVVDQNGLHNHWQIELLMKDGSAIRLGYGLLGSIRRSSADALIEKVSALTGLPIRQLEKR